MGEQLEFCKPFPVIGQGTFFFTCDNRKEFSIAVHPQKFNVEDDNPPISDDYIALRVFPDRAQFMMKMNNEEEVVLCEVQGTVYDLKSSKKVLSGISTVGANPELMDTYWYSYDSLGQVLKYGKGYTMESTTLMTYDLREDPRWGDKDSQKRKDITKLFFNPHNQKWIKVFSLQWVRKSSLIQLQKTFSFRAEPFVSDLPPFVMDSSKVTLFDLDKAKYVFSSSLPPACQELYANIKGLMLEEGEDPMVKLSDAIRYSINTEGCHLYDRLREKQGEFDGLQQTYLRVTLGPNLRTGPGIPYVLEIWPSGHGSPIHNHGGSCAIIKVLYGRISVKIFNKMTDPVAQDPTPLMKVDFEKGDVTWLTPDWYQTHQLENPIDDKNHERNDFCATIQCYSYSDQDKIRYDGFDYYPENNNGDQLTPLDEFIPDSDFTFLQLRQLVLDDYQEYLSKERPGQAKKAKK